MQDNSSLDFQMFHTVRDIHFRQLMDVYAQSNRCYGAEHFPRASESEQLLMAENEFYRYLSEIFFCDPCARYAVLKADGRYVAALRMEPYRDGLLIEALETLPQARGKGYATALLGKVTAAMAQQGSVTLYSHIAKDNLTSLAVHKANGFAITQEHAVFADGSVSHQSYTLRCKL